ncbi:MAG: hypothetical protein IJX74_00855 [Clostridia bacterium]|nr:hypothetical protein [Clostridia bacterium]
MKTNSKRSLQLRVLSIVILMAMLLNFAPMAIFAEEIANVVENEEIPPENEVDSGDVVEPDDDGDATVDYSNAVDVASADELEAALAAGSSAIRIMADFELDRTFYVVSDTVIVADEAHTLQRAADFGSDIFVIGENSDGTATAEPVIFTVGKPDDFTASMIVIDGNSENMTADVVGTVFFVRQGSRTDLYYNLTVQNHIKIGNEKTAREEYKLSYPVRIGGAVAIVSYKAAMQIYGGLYTNNSVNDITDSSTDEGTVSSQGGAIYNYGTLDIFGGTFDGNHAGRGGALYNYRTMNIYNAKIINNTASTLGGAIYVPNSTSAYLYIGEDNDTVESSVVFENNSSESSGGAIYAQHVASVKNTQFIGNTTAAGHGGAIAAGAMELSIESSAFDGNTATAGYGGAIYITGNNEDEDIKELIVDGTEFTNNSSKRGGAIYMSGTARGYFASVDFSENSSTTYGGAIYATNASVEINGANITNNTATTNGGGVSLYSSASAVMNNVTADGNSASVGGFVYQTAATLSLYNSTIKNNSADKNGGAVYAYTDGVFNAYATVFSKNTASTGGAVMIYNGGLDSLIHSCIFENNIATGSGGAIYISNKSQVDLYNIRATGNSAVKGGFMYETTAGTVVTLVGLVLSGNTATEGGAIIWGNTTNAKLYIDKIKYVDNDYAGDWDDTYWSTAIYNLLTVYDKTGTIPSYVDYSGATVEPPVAESITNVQTAAQLERALEVGYTLIRITADFELDRTFYVTSSVTIFADEAHTLKRAPDFGGDIFVVGENADGKSKKDAVLTLAKLDGSDAALTIDGNSAEMAVDVVGTVLFVCDDSKANLGTKLTVTNNNKVGNDRTTAGDYSLSYPARIGGAVAIVENGGELNVWGGAYSNNTVNDITAATDEGSLSSQGGAFYNHGVMNIYGGTFTNNHAGRGGSLYNYRTLRIYNGTFTENSSSTLGGVLYTPASTGAYLYVGYECDEVENGEIIFKNNTATSGGGALYLCNFASIKNATFEGNSAATSHGGAIYASATRMTISDSEFIGNSTASKHGAAIYLTGNNEREETREMVVYNTTFDQNTSASRAGAIYMSGNSRAYFEDTDFTNNTATTGGVFYLNGAHIEINGATISGNSATSAEGGVIYLISSATALLNDVTVTGNSAKKSGGVAYIEAATLDIYNSVISDNTANTSGGAVHAADDAVFNAYGTDFIGNTSVANGGALMIYNGGTNSVIHSCTFAENVGAYGGALYISNKSQVQLYNITATDNSADKGGFMYETTSGTVVKLVGLTVSGNTATTGGPIIWGNTTNAKLQIDKSKYTDLDASGDYDSDYWKAAIYNKLTHSEITEDIPKYLDYGNEAYDHMADAIDVATADELETAILSGAKHIRVVADFELDRTFYITGDTTIFTTIGHTLTRAPDFGGDIFVIGENADGKSALLMGNNAKLTLGNPLSTQKDLLVFDGNSENMTVDVVGSVLFIGYSSTVELYENVTVQNFCKVGNLRTLDEKYILSIENRIGGTLAVVASGTLNIYGGHYVNNTINDEGDTSLGEEERHSTVGGLIFNNSNLNIYGGTFEANRGARGGVIYSYRITRIFGGSFIGNEATVSGGVYYSPNSAQVHLYVGTTDGAHGEVVFSDNVARSSGGVIYASTLTANVIYGHASFTNNSSTKGSGGAICMYGQLTVRDSSFEGNTATNRGGAVYASKSSLNSITRYVELTRCTFTANEATLGGSLSLYASSADYPEGAIATVTDCTFTGNKASLEIGNASSASGGAIYADRKVSLTVKNGEFTENSAATEAGAIYIAGESMATVTDSVMSSNTSGKHGGAIVVRSSYLTLDGVEITESIAAANGGAIYVSYQSNREINSKVEIKNSVLTSNTATSNGGAIYATRRSALEDEWNILTITDTVFKSNSAGVNGGALSTLSKVGVYVENSEFTENTATVDEDGQGGAWYLAGSTVEINGATFSSNSANNAGGALKITSSATVTMNNVTAAGNASGNGGFIHVDEATLNIYNSDISANSSTKNGGAVYAYTDAIINVYNTSFSQNTCAENGGSLMIYTAGSQSVLHTCTFDSNVADGAGGALYISNKSLVDMYNITATDNSADKGGFMYETTSGTVVKLVGLTVSGNTATTGGPIIWGNTVNAKLNIDKSKYTDNDATGELNADYWATAIYNLLTVAEISSAIPSYDDYVHEIPEADITPEKAPVSVNDVFDLAQNTNDGYISKYYEDLPVLDKSSNFLSDGVTYFENINGGTVTVDSFVYAAYAKDGIATASEGILIYQAMLYKQAHPEEEVSIAISAYRFSIEAAVNINRNSRYFGYMRQLVGCEYDEFGFVRVSYLLVSAAKMGINVTVIGQLDAYPINSSDPNFYEYFTAHLDTPCDADYAEGVVGDYMNFSFCYWTLEQKGGTDMMHTKLCAVSHYLDINGVEHKNAVWTSSSNLDGITSKGYNANWKLQTATIVSDHEYIYRVSANYLRLISEYCGQEQIYEFQDFMSREGARQIDLILAGKDDEIPADEQLVYLGTESDDVFELYFTPFAGGTTVWDEAYNPYCKYLREMYDSEDSIIFIWNAAEYNSNFPLGQQMEDIIVGSFFNNKNVENKFYGMMENFDGTKLNGLTVGKDIGLISLNEFKHDSVHNKDILMSYVKDGQRYYVSLLNSCNMHAGSMCYQSNFMLVIKETDCEEDSVFFNMADLTTVGIVEHTYGDEQTFIPETNEHGYYYIPCIYCDEKIITGTIHRPGEWIVDKEATLGSNGVQHKDCTVCGSIVEMKEVSVGEKENENTDVGMEGMWFTGEEKMTTGISQTPLTFEAYIQLSKQHLDRGGVIVGNYDGMGANQINLEIYNYGQVRLYIKNNGIKDECFFESDIRSDTPVHIAVTVDGKIARLYIDGALADTQLLSGNIPAISDELMIGRDNRLYNSPYFKGEIYSVALFSDVRTEAEIAKDMFVVANDADGLLYSRSFATAPNSDSIENIGISPDENTNISLEALSSAPLTVEAIISLPTTHTGRGGVVFGNYDGSTQNQINLEIYDNGVPRLYVNKAGYASTVYFDADVRTGVPTHIAVVMSGKTATLYVDGEIADTAEFPYAIPSVTDNFMVGGDHRANNAQYFKGKIYAVGLYSVAKNANEIKRDSLMMDNASDSLLYLNYFTKVENAADNLEEGTRFTADSSVSVDTLASAPHTIEATIRILPSYWDRAGVIVGNYDNGTGAQINLEVYYNGRARLFYNDGITKGECLFSGTDIRSYDKRHIAVTVDGQTAYLYVDGDLKETKAMLIDLPEATENFRIGGDNRVDNVQYFKGELYSVYMFSDARTADEIKSDFASVAADAESLIYSCNLTDEIKSATTPEYRPTGHTFDGIHIDRIDDLTTAPYTMEAVLHVPTTMDGRAGVIFGNYYGDDSQQITFEIYEMGRVRLFFVNNSVRVNTIFNTDIRSDAPVHIALTVDGTLATLYVDGEAVETAQLPLELPVTTKNYVVGGDNRYENSQYFKGEIYSLALFGDVRSAEEIKADSLLTPTEADDLMYSVVYGYTDCNPHTADNDHVVSDWIIDREATATSNGLKHKECTVCGKLISVKEISCTYTDVNNVSIADNAGLTLGSESDALNTDIIASSPMTFEALIQLSPDYRNRAGVIIGSYDGGSGDAINFEIYTEGNPRLYYKVNGVGYSHVFSTDIRSNSFTHVALTIDGLTVKLYVNGVLAETVELTVAVPEITSDFNVGNDKRATSGQYFKGTIYGVTMFDDVRTADEIALDAILVVSNAEGILYSKYYKFE